MLPIHPFMILRLDAETAENKCVDIPLMPYMLLTSKVALAGINTTGNQEFVYTIVDTLRSCGNRKNAGLVIHSGLQILTAIFSRPSAEAPPPGPDGRFHISPAPDPNDTGP